MSQNTKPPFRADHVGSLLRPAALKDARAHRARMAKQAKVDLVGLEASARGSRERSPLSCLPKIPSLSAARRRRP